MGTGPLILMSLGLQLLLAMAPTRLLLRIATVRVSPAGRALSSSIRINSLKVSESSFSVPQEGKLGPLHPVLAATETSVPRIITVIKQSIAKTQLMEGQPAHYEF